MADTFERHFGIKNPFVIASSPATHGVANILKSAQAKPGAIVMRNYGHTVGGGSEIRPYGAQMARGEACQQTHALATNLTEDYTCFQEYIDDVARVRDQLDPDVKLWVSVGYLLDLNPDCNWYEKWVMEAQAYESVGVDAIEMHLNSPGIAYLGDENGGFLNIVRKSVKATVEAANIPVMCKLPVEGCNCFQVMQEALNSGAYAVGPTARWRGMLFDIDLEGTSTAIGSGYGCSQSLPIISYVAAKARQIGITAPMFAGGGVYTAEAAAKLIMAGSNIVQLGSLACCCGPRAVEKLILEFEKLMVVHGFADLESMVGIAAKITPQDELKRADRLGIAYKAGIPDPDKCIGCGRCEDVCWYDGIRIKEKKAQKTDKCVGCGYCYNVCPTGALTIDRKAVLCK